MSTNKSSSSQPVTTPDSGSVSSPSTTAHDQIESKPDSSSPLPLPAPSSDAAHRLDMSGGSATVKMDHLGPLVVNVDGTLSRIANWEQMTAVEQRNTVRILGKRNQLRLDGLRGGSEGDQGDGVGRSDGQEERTGKS